ncbi:hypothetical protein [Paenibacillus lautus]|uniref:hypothetical protein n=1 Tax=Paenibacillus lautus TaxID=1401 RepID=UPI003D2E304E
MHLNWLQEISKDESVSFTYDDRSEGLLGFQIKRLDPIEFKQDTTDFVQFIIASNIFISRDIVVQLFCPSMCRASVDKPLCLSADVPI